MDIVISHQGETVDALCYRYYGDGYITDAAVQVYQANQGLAEYGPTLAVGTPVNMPRLEKTDTKETVQLWD